MNCKLQFFFIIFTLLFNFFTFSESGDVLFDPKEIIIKPKVINGHFLFIIKYSSDDFKLLVKKSLHNKTADKRFTDRGFSEINVLDYLGKWEWMGNQHNGAMEVTYYGESITATIKNIESNQEFKILIFPFMRKAYIPNLTTGKYKFEKLTLTICLGNSNLFNNNVFIGSELPEFEINSNTAVIYGIINLKGGEIRHTNEEKKMAKLRKYVDLLKKFKKNENMKVVEFNAQQ